MVTGRVQLPVLVLRAFHLVMTPTPGGEDIISSVLHPLNHFLVPRTPASFLHKAFAPTAPWSRRTLHSSLQGWLVLLLSALLTPSQPSAYSTHSYPFLCLMVFFSNLPTNKNYFLCTFTYYLCFPINM